MAAARTYRIGTGAGFSADRLGPAVDLARDGRLDCLVLECLGERTVAFAHRDKRADPAKGYNAHLERRLRALLPVCRAGGTRIVTNMGAANPRAAALKTVEVARGLGLRGLKVACIEGDDVAARVDPGTPLLDEPGTLGDVGLPLVGMNAYLGADAILPALEAGADVVIGGRLADPSMFLAPLMHHFGWRPEDARAMGAGTLVGHLMECGMQVTGGYFADPGVKDVARLAECGFPIAEVDGDGSAVITKLAAAGGCVSLATVKEQLLYEVHDPARYLTPDVTADFSRVRIEAVGPDRVRVSGAGGSARPQSLKVTVGFDDGFHAEAGVSYAGVGAQARGELAARIVTERMLTAHGIAADLRVDVIGAASLFASAGLRSEAARDVRVHAAMRSRRREEAEMLLWEVESLLCCGPAGGGGYRGAITPCVMTKSVLVARDKVAPSLEVMVA
ncbi:MAG: acyclic terpene utilization AtuA family protein [Hyphomicrobiaceae bacterium]|nr:acyclic terpene utilization AtuA family protein [Hyphomicrobiaceae bacterium]